MTEQLNYQFKNLKKREEKKTTLKQVLQNELTIDEMNYLTSSYDLIGDIIIIEVKDELKHKEKQIGQALLQLHKNVKTICKRAGEHSGKYRTQKVKIIAGKKTKDAIYKENNCTFKLNVEKCYFSVRSSTERKRMASLIQPGEDVLVMFSGIAPFVCVIAKLAKPNEIYGIEINLTAHKYALENLKMNKISNATLIQGEVTKIIPKLNKKFDRVVMPLPKNAEDFLGEAMIAVKPNGIIHLYDFLNVKEFYLGEEKVKKACEKAGKKYKILDFVKCGEYAPYTYRVCIDFQVLD